MATKKKMDKNEIVFSRSFGGLKFDATLNGASMNWNDVLHLENIYCEVRNGQEMYKELKAKYPNLKFILCNGGEIEIYEDN